MVRGSNPSRGESFRTCPDRPWGPHSLLYNGYRVFPGGKESPGRDADPSPPSSAAVKKEQNYTSTPPMGHMACTEPQCLYTGALYLTYHNNYKLPTHFVDECPLFSLSSSDDNSWSDPPEYQLSSELTVR